MASQDKDISGKPKVKYFKRKAEVVDAKADAGKISMYSKFGLRHSFINSPINWMFQKKLLMLKKNCVL